MSLTSNRLHFLDAMRAFAILMMLQGHFVHALLASEYHDRSNFVYARWEYFRGITAPVFFSVTGFVFCYLLLKRKEMGWANPRVKLGIKRALKLIFWGYVIRLSLGSVFSGGINTSFFYVDVLQCIGVSLLLLISLYLLCFRKRGRGFQILLLVLGMSIFLFEPLYENYGFGILPETISNYFTKANGSIFTLFQRFGYVCIGGFLASVYKRLQHFKGVNIYSGLLLIITGFALIYGSSAMFRGLSLYLDIAVFGEVANNNYLFMRLGDVFIIMAICIWSQKLVSGELVSKIGSRTLSIYIVHFFVLYGSWFGFGLNHFFSKALNPLETFVGAILFGIGVCCVVLYYYKYELVIKNTFYDVIHNKYSFINKNMLLVKQLIVKRYKKS